MTPSPLNENDFIDAKYNIYASKRRFISATVQDKQFTLLCEDFSPDCEVMSGKDEYEFYYALNEKNTVKFFVQLRIEYDVIGDLSENLKNAFGFDGGTVEFEVFCKKNKIRYTCITL